MMKGAVAFIVVSAVVAGSDTVFSIVVVDEGDGAVVVAITVTVVPWSPIVVIVLAVGAGAIVVSFVIVSVDIIEIEAIVLDDGVGTIFVAVVVDNEGAVVVKSTHPAFSWDRGRITTLVYWLMDSDLDLKM